MRKFIGASEGASIYIFGLCGGSILANVLTRLMVTTGAFAGMPIINWVMYAVNQIAFLLVIVLYFAWRKIEPRSVLSLRAPRNVRRNPLYLLLLPLISVAAIIAFLPVTNLFTKLLGAMGYPLVPPSTPAAGSVGVYFLSLFVMALMPAIGEEFMMRGALFSGLKSRGTWFAVLMSALLFSLMHANPLQTVHQFGLGIVLALVVLISGSVWCSVFIHFFNNFISFTVNAYMPQVDEWYASLGNLQYLSDFGFALLGIILLVVLLWWFNRLSDTSKKEGYRVVSDGVVYEEFAIYATAEEKRSDFKYKLSNSSAAAMFRFLGSLFTKAGWRKLGNSLDLMNEVPYLGKQQPMFNVWLALGFGVLNWLLALILGLI